MYTQSTEEQTLSVFCSALWLCTVLYKSSALICAATQTALGEEHCFFLQIKHHDNSVIKLNIKWTSQKSNL